MCVLGGLGVDQGRRCGPRGWVGAYGKGWAEGVAGGGEGKGES